MRWRANQGKVSSFVKSQQKTLNLVKYEVIDMTLCVLYHKDWYGHAHIN